MTRHAITGVELVGGPPGPSTIVWEHDRLTAVGPDATTDTAGAAVTDGSGRWALPGLIDAHVHLCVDPAPDGIDRLSAEPFAHVAMRAAAAAGTMLDHGITTVRDQGSRDGVSIDVGSAAAAGIIRGCRVVAAGRGLTPPEGHGWMIGVEVRGADAMRGAVATEVERGARVIKLFPTGGVLGSGAHGFEVTMTAEEVAAAVAEAHRLGVLVGAHVHGPEGMTLCLDAGVDTIEHGTALTPGQAARMADAGVALVPTLAAIHAILDHPAEVPGPVVGRARVVAEKAADGVTAAIAAGVTVLPGTDAGTPFNPPGFLVREMRLLSDLGLGHAGVITAATSGAAGVLGLDGFGVLEPGAVADLSLVGADPVADLDVLRTPSLVVLGGRIEVGPARVGPA